MSYFGIPIRNGLPIGLGSVAPLASGGGSPFSPLSLFSGGAPGAWYDPSDFSTLFQDSAGTTPVTAVEQPVGLMLDKSQGLVLGSELVTSPYVVSGTGWTSASSSITHTGAIGVGAVTTDSIPVVGKMYVVTFTASDLSGATSFVNFGSDTSNTSLQKRIATAGNYSFKLTATNTTGLRFAPYEGADFGVTISNISVKELAGNHAFQATSASRPVLSARYNLLTKTEQFDDAVWAVQGATKTTGVLAPDGTTTAVTIAITSNTGNNFIQLLAGLPSESRIATAMVKGTAGQQVFFAADDSTPQTLVTFTGDWQTVTNTQTASGNVYFVFEIFNRSGGAALPNVTFSVWHPDLRVANNGITQPTYQRVNTATDYATTGFLPYLKFDGVDDSLSTNSISFTSTDKMSVFAGVRKLSSVVGIISELGPSVANGGSFGLFCEGSPGAINNYSFASSGTSVQISVAAPFVAPITNTITGLGNISGDLVTLRANGAQVAQNTGDQGTGSYGNYPLYIGRRNNAIAPLNGQLYSMIIVGKAVTAGELSSTETYVNQKTGAY